MQICSPAKNLTETKDKEGERQTLSHKLAIEPIVIAVHVLDPIVTQ